MLKDIDFPEINDVFVAIIPANDGIWEVHIINDTEKSLEHVFVSSKGYGRREGKEIATSSIRQRLGAITPKSSKPIESLNEELSKLNNEFWVSFYKDGQLFDKKYVFTSESFSDKHLTSIPVLDCQGILHS